MSKLGSGSTRDRFSIVGVIPGPGIGPLESHYCRRLGAAVEYLLAENELLLQEIQTCRDTLGARKTRKTGKRMKLEGAIVLSLKEYYEAARDCEEATKAKRKPIGKPRGRPRKTVSKKAVDDEEDELEALEVAFAERLAV